jgi:hypothetical protein
MKNISRRSCLERIASTGITLSLVGAYTLFPPRIEAQQEGTPIRQGRMSQIEALGRIETASTNLPYVKVFRKEPSAQIQTLDRGSYEKNDYLCEITEEETPEFQSVKNNLSEILSQCDDREALYKANFLMARLMFNFNRDRSKKAMSMAKDRTRENRLLIEFPFKGRGVYYDFSETWDFIERAVIQFPEQEEKFGLGYKGLEKMSDAFFEVVEGSNSFLDISRCYELANEFSKYPQKDMPKLKANLDTLLNKAFREVNFKRALNFLFPESVSSREGDISYYNRDANKILSSPDDEQLEEYYIPWGIAKLENVRVGYEAGKSRAFPNMCFKLIELDKKPEHTPGDKKIFYKSGEPWKGAKVVYKDKSDKTQDWAHFSEIKVKEGVTIREFLEAAGVNPYDWCYNKGNADRTTELTGDKW